MKHATVPIPEGSARRALASVLVVAVISAVTIGSAHADATTDEVSRIREAWELITYRTPVAEQANRLESLAAQAHRVSTDHAGRAEPLIWEGIVVSSLAGAKGGLGALGLAKDAREKYEAAIKIDDKALDGSAYNSLGVLYYKVPGWPLGFGDRKKAAELLQRALSLNPDGIDPNYFYGDYLVHTGRAGEAIPFLERAIKAPDRPGRQVADEGRRAEARALLIRAKSLL